MLLARLALVTLVLVFLLSGRYDGVIISGSDELAIELYAILLWELLIVSGVVPVLVSVSSSFPVYDDLSLVIVSSTVSTLNFPLMVGRSPLLSLLSYPPIRRSGVSRGAWFSCLLDE